MDKIYKIVGQYIDVSELRYIGPLINPLPNHYACQIYFRSQEPDINGRPLCVYANFITGRDGFPTENCEAAARDEITKLVKYWNEYRDEQVSINHKQ